jgi:polyribonucleotide nucleotidyltransferase
MSANPEVDSDIPALIGASAALALSGLPFDGPVGAARVGYIDGQYVLNPTTTELKTSKLDLVVAGTESAVLMVESEADQLPEDVMLGAVVFGHEQMQAAIDAINDLADECRQGRLGLDRARDRPTALLDKMNALSPMRSTRPTRSSRSRIRVAADGDPQPGVRGNDQRRHGTPPPTWSRTCSMRSGSQGGARPHPGRRARIDGRDTRTVRPITIRTGVLPRTHGSALFTRGETQALVVATLGTGRDEQIIEALTGGYSDYFMLHYNMPPSPPAKPAGGAVPSAARSATAVWPSARWWPACRARKNSATPFAWCPRSPNPTAPPPWLPCVAAAWR